MAVKTVIIDRKFYNQYKNGLNFTNNLGDFTTNLAASVGEIVKVIYTLDVSYRFASNAAAGNGLATVSELSPGVLQLGLNPGKSWANEGFAIGDTVYITWIDNGGAQADNTGTIASITNNTMIVNWGGFPIPGNINGWVNDSTVITGTSDLTALEYGFGINDNGATNIDIASAVSGNDQRYDAKGIGLGAPRSTAFVPMTKMGQYQDWVTGSMQVRFDSNPLTAGGGTIPLSQRFEVEHIFMVLPYFVDGELTNLQNNVIPPILAGQNSLKYNFETNFLRVFNNPNTAKKFVSTNNLGSVAWFNEPFNGFNAEYKVNSVVYTEQATTNSASGLLISTKTRVTMEVEALNRNFVGGDLVGIMVSYLPGSAEYTNTVLTDLKENFLYDNAFQGAGAAGAVGQDFITQFDVFNPFANIMVLKFDVEYSTAQKMRLANLNSTQGPINFVIGVQLGDNNLTSTNADRLTLLADVNEYDESADIPGLMDDR